MQSVKVYKQRTVTEHVTNYLFMKILILFQHNSMAGWPASLDLTYHKINVLFVNQMQYYGLE